MSSMERTETKESYLRLIETVLGGIGPGDSSPRLIGMSHYERQQMRAEWMVKCLPRTAGMIGVEWDGIERLRWRA